MEQDNELLLADRIQVIRLTNERYDLEKNAYLSFSGGKDSTTLHYLLDEAMPGNKIPRVYMDTGIEYNHIRKFVKGMAEKDERFVIIKPSQPIKQMLERVGYPFKSKEHSLRVDQFNKGHNANYLKKYLGETEYKGKHMCPKILLYQFQERGKYHYSNQCCNELKKKPAHRWAKENNRKIIITGMLAEEGGNRERLGCVITDKNGNLEKFHPLIKVDSQFEDWYIEQRNIRLCDLYYPPYNFPRTGCKGCPYSLTLDEQLATMQTYLPEERNQCEMIWKPVYDEYRRLGYRLEKIEQTKLF